MWKNIGYEKCLAFINCQLGPQPEPDEREIRPAITISRMTGAGGHAVAGKLVELLPARLPAPCGWTVFDKTLMERVLADHHLSTRVAKYQPENHQPFLRDALEEFLGLHPSSWQIVQQTAETIWQLAKMGYVILVGRGASVVTAKLDNVLHVRLVGSLERRIARVQEVYRLEPKAAAEFVKSEDKGRSRYLREQYERNIDDPLIYDLIINTDSVGYDGAAWLIREAVAEKCQRAKLKPATMV